MSVRRFDERPGRFGGRVWRRRYAPAGFTILELLLVIIVATVLLSVAYGGYRQFNEAVVVKKAAGVIGSDVGLARNLAVQRRANVSLVAFESARRYEIHDENGAVLHRRSFDRTAALPLDVLDVQAAGDSLTFNARGLLATGANAVIAVGRGDRSREVRINALGRYKISDRL